jgi:hypothetical protein
MTVLRYILIGLLIAGSALIGLNAAGYVGFHDTRLVDNTPLRNPVEVVAVTADHLELADGRKIRVAEPTLLKLDQALKDTDHWIAVETPDDDRRDDVVIYAKERTTNFDLVRPAIVIPVHTVYLPKYQRRVGTPGTLVGRGD